MRSLFQAHPASNSPGREYHPAAQNARLHSAEDFREGCGGKTAASPVGRRSFFQGTRAGEYQTIARQRSACRAFRRNSLRQWPFSPSFPSVHQPFIITENDSLRRTASYTVMYVNIVLISTYELGRQPFGLASPAAWLRKRGHNLVCLDLSRQSLNESAVRAAEF